MTKGVKDEFSKMLKEITWMDNESKAKAQRKVFHTFNEFIYY